MRNMKRFLIMSMSAATLLSVPVSTEAATVKEPVSINRGIEAEGDTRPLSVTTYTDEDGNEVTERVYFTPDKQTSSGRMRAQSVSGEGTYKKEKEVLIRTGSTTKTRVKFYVKIRATFGGGKANVESCNGKITNNPKKIRITGAKPYKGSNTGEYVFYAESNYSKKQKYSVKITIHSNGAVS